MTIPPTARKKTGKVGPPELLSPRELRGIIQSVLRLAKSTGSAETEVHVDEVADALTRFANNGIHQNVFERVVTVSIRTATGGRTARATTNRLDEDSLRATIEASLSLAHSQPRDPRLLPMPGLHASDMTSFVRSGDDALAAYFCDARVMRIA